MRNIYSSGTNQTHDFKHSNSYKNEITWADDTCLISPACKIQKSGSATLRAMTYFQAALIFSLRRQKSDISEITKTQTNKPKLL